MGYLLRRRSFPVLVVLVAAIGLFNPTISDRVNAATQGALQTHALSPSYYVALGDSYSSGEGNPGPTATRWVNYSGIPTGPPYKNLNNCDRSAVAYPMIVNSWLKSVSGLPTMNFGFYACSGATTGDLWPSGARRGALAEPLQLSHTSELLNARVITLSVGGDDLNFTDILTNCTLGVHTSHSCSSSSNDGWIADLHTNILNLESTLVSTYKQIIAAAPNATLFVVGYPDLLPPRPSTLQQNVTCPKVTLILPRGVGYLSYNEQALNNVVRAAVAQVPGVEYVDPNAGGVNSFIGHSVCAKNSWFNGIRFVGASRLLDASYSFHPNAVGQQKLAAAVENVIRTKLISAHTSKWTYVDSSIGPLSVTCPSTSFCAASDPQGNVATYSGTVWSATKYVDTSGGNLNSVSCATTAQSEFCAGVDDLGYVVTFNGSSWDQPQLIDPNGYGLVRVSCATTIFCVAVDANGSAFVYAGTNWILESNIDPSSGQLWAVNCPTSTFCAAFDLAGNVVMYNGTVWSAPVSVDSTGGIQGGTISCPSASFCAVSDSLGDVITFNGASWSQPSQIDTNRLTSISCTSANFCIAVDLAGNVLTYNGSQWSQPTLLSPAGVLWAVVCPTPTYCTAVGDNGIFTYN